MFRNQCRASFHTKDRIQNLNKELKEKINMLQNEGYDIIDRYVKVGYGNCGKIRVCGNCGVQMTVGIDVIISKQSGCKLAYRCLECAKRFNII